MPKPIEEVDEETQHLLTASVTIPTLDVLVKELVYNSIDNGATCIAVRVTLEKTSRLQVVDNGHGVSNLKHLGSQPQTNKRKISRSLYGTRRGCLRHIIKLCEKLTITSRRHNTTHSKTFLAYKAPEFVTEKRNRPSSGTTVSIENIFSRMPVRSVSMSYMDIDRTKDCLLMIALANPTVAITLRDTKSGAKILQTHASSSYVDNFMMHCNDNIDFEMLKHVQYELNGHKLDALFSVELATKPRQIVFVNRRCVEDPQIKTFANDILLSALGTADKKNSENRYPVFVLFITCKPINVDMSLVSNTFLEFKDWDIVFGLVYNSIYSFLEQEEVTLPVSDDDVPLYSDSTLPSLTRLLAGASPMFKIKSDKAQRREKILSKSTSLHAAKPTTLVITPKKTHTKNSPKKLIPMKRCSPTTKMLVPKKKSKLTRSNTNEKAPSKDIINVSLPTHDHSDNFSFKTPSPVNKYKHLSQLQNAPVLKHLIAAKMRLDHIDEADKPSAKRSISMALSDASDPSNKRRSSTPLCLEKNELPMFNLSPIVSNLEQRLTGSLLSDRVKRRRHNPSDKKCTKKSEVFLLKDAKSFHMKTPAHIQQKQKHLCMLPSPDELKIFDKENILPHDQKRTDSGYDTTSKQSDRNSCEQNSRSSYPFKIMDNGKDDLSERQYFEVEVSANETEIYSTSESPEKRAFSVLQDECVKVNEASVESADSITYNKSPPKYFEVYRSKEPETGVTEESEEIQFVSPPVPKRFEVYKDESLCQSPIITTKDCASSPIRIPVDKGCSPIVFPTSPDLEIIPKSPIVHKSTDVKAIQCESINVDELSIVAKPTKSTPILTQEFDICALDDLDVSEIDRLIKRCEADNLKDDEPEQLSDIPPTPVLDSTDPACLDCNTQKVKQRLDFSSQCQERFDPLAQTTELISKQLQNPEPEYEISVPISAASHIVADCSAWYNPATKLTMNKGPVFDMRKWRNPVFDTYGEGSLNARNSDPLNVKFFLDNCKFDKTSLDDIKVLGQMDNKFIGCVLRSGLLVAVDQHAAHERIRLECMLNTIRKDNDITNPVISHALKHQIPIKVNKHDIEMIKHITYKLQHVGFYVDLSKYHCQLTEVPKFCFTECGDLNISTEDIIEVFRQLVEQIKVSDGSDIGIPAKLIDYLHTKSCHGAIRFGDELTLEQCKTLMQQLRYCDLPFQCAHGRPSFAPIVKLKGAAKEEGVKELDFMKLRSRFQ